MPPVVGKVLDSPGQPLEPRTVSLMQRRIGHDFSQVRVHADTRAAESARAVGALAYTTGQHVAFAAGRYAPETAEGRRLLAHELTHVVQQREGPSTPSTGVPTLRGSGAAAEREADRVAGSFAAGYATPRITVPVVTGTVQRQQSPQGETEIAEEEAVGEEGTTEPAYMATSVIWFQLNSDRPREDSEVSSTTHLALALGRIREHAAVAGDFQRITLHGYASREGTESRNRTLSEMRAERVRQLLIDAGVPEARITTVGHGPDSTIPGLKWNRRVEIELKPSVSRTEFTEEEGAEVVGTPPRTGPKPLESTKDVLTPSHWALRERPRIPADPIGGWSEWDAATMKAERMWSGKSKTLLDYKDAWVRAHRAAIRQAAAESDLPDWFLAGVAWAEVGGDPAFLDYLGHAYRRDIGIGSKPAEETSFGAVSVQVRRAAEELGYDPTKLTKMQTSFIIRSLEDAQQNLFIVASHLDRLRDQDFPGKPAELLTDEDLKVIGARYNRGPDLSLEKIKENLSYGESIVNKKDKLQGLLAD